MKVGTVEAIEVNRKKVDKAGPKDGAVSVRISGQPNVAFGRHFTEANQVCSFISRRSIDALKDFFRDEMT